MVVVMSKTMDSQLSHMSIQEQAKERTFVEALHKRYVQQNEFDDIVGKGDIIREADTTFFGFSKISSIQRQLRGLFSLDLSSMKISSAGDTSQLKDLLLRVNLLNLANNSLTWLDVVAIIDILPNVKEIVLTQNEPLELRNQIDLKEVTNQRRLKSVTLGKLRLNWDATISTLSKICSSIEQLDLWACELTADDMILINDQDEPTKSNFIRDIQSLMLGKNKFTDIQWIESIGSTDNLVELDLSNCYLTSFDMSDKIVDQLKQLKSLNISYNQLANWQDISQLHRLKYLANLICHENPFYDSEKFPKHLTIGRLSSIKVINREPIGRSERRDAEVLYLRKTFPDYKLSTEGKLNNFKVSHPRYDELIELYGLPEDLNKKEQNDKYINIDLCYNDTKVNRKLPCDMRVANVQMLCKRLFKLKLSTNIRLLCRGLRSNGESIEYELDKDCQTLHFFSVKNGHSLVVLEN